MTLLLMGIATTLIGLVPDAHAIGWAAPVFLVLLRLIQEFGGAVLMCAETAPKKRRGLFYRQAHDQNPFMSSKPEPGGLQSFAGLRFGPEQIRRRRFRATAGRLP
jgi:hypothetical protein